MNWLDEEGVVPSDRRRRAGCANITLAHNTIRAGGQYSLGVGGWIAAVAYGILLGYCFGLVSLVSFRSKANTGLRLGLSCENRLLDQRRKYANTVYMNDIVLARDCLNPTENYISWNI